MQAFRTGGTEGTRRIRLRALDPAARYRFTDPYGGAEAVVSGGDAVGEGFRFDLAPMSSAVRLYRKE